MADIASKFNLVQWVNDETKLNEENMNGLRNAILSLDSSLTTFANDTATTITNTLKGTIAGNNLGVVRIDSQYGIGIRDDGTLTINPANKSAIENKSSSLPLTPANIDVIFDKGLREVSLSGKFSLSEDVQNRFCNYINAAAKSGLDSLTQRVIKLENNLSSNYYDRTSIDSKLKDLSDSLSDSSSVAVKKTDFADSAADKNGILKGVQTSVSIEEGVIKISTPTSLEIKNGAKGKALTIDNIKDLLDIFYPVGSYYWTSQKAFNPEESFTGKWVKVEGSFVFAYSDEYKDVLNYVNYRANESNLTYNTETKKEITTPMAGQSAVTLSLENLPEHNHSANLTIPFTVYDNKQIVRGTGRSAVLGNTPTWGLATSGKGVKVTDGYDGSSAYGAHWEDINVGYSGADKPFSIMPPFILAYCWRRVS